MIITTSSVLFRNTVINCLKPTSTALGFVNLHSTSAQLYCPWHAKTSVNYNNHIKKLHGFTKELFQACPYIFLQINSTLYNVTHANGNVFDVINSKEGIRPFHTIANHAKVPLTIFLSRNESSKTEDEERKEPVLSRRDKFKRIVAEYGTTVIVFHIGISLISLGSCYMLITSGVDVDQILASIGLNEDHKLTKLASNAGPFVAAYAVHKVFAPVRLGITAAATPFIVRYLRRVGILKKPPIK